MMKLTRKLNAPLIGGSVALVNPPTFHGHCAFTAKVATSQLLTEHSELAK